MINMQLSTNYGEIKVLKCNKYCFKCLKFSGTFNVFQLFKMSTVFRNSNFQKNWLRHLFTSPKIKANLQKSLINQY